MARVICDAGPVGASALCPPAASAAEGTARNASRTERNFMASSDGGALSIGGANPAIQYGANMAPASHDHPSTVNGLSDRRALARSITLVESTRAEDRARAEALLASVLPRTGGAMRIGISGAPGVGKST